ncbi:MAG TPA: LysR family transcriptional regulator [Burkholderiales bacterium]|jgi:DNA-binding transcriptional LysR family regulator|nr:LysR family transcriptional regulator [Burkholderiales bacterium]
MTPILHLNDLQCFVVVYELGSFSRAADTMDTAQSQVSTRIQRLERFAGTRLFARLPHGIRPNGKGELFYQHAKRVLSDVAELETAVRQGTAGAQAKAVATRNQQQLSISAEGEWIWSARSMWYFAERAG